MVTEEKVENWEYRMGWNKANEAKGDKMIQATLDVVNFSKSLVNYKSSLNQAMICK